MLYAIGIHLPSISATLPDGMTARIESLTASLTLGVALLLAACSGVDTRSTATPSPSSGASSSITRPAGTPGAAVATAPLADSRRSPATSNGPLYACVTERAGVRNEIAIDLEPKVAALCARHPEMGPCQYERESCRKSGGRVFAMDGREITRQTEDEYDRKVMRVRFRAN
jgi:hypothetical protein